MADWNIAYNWMMEFEDPARAYATVPDRCPAGCAGPCFAISGVNSGVWPKEFATLKFLPQEMRGSGVEQFYYKNFWNEWYAQLDSDEVAKRVFDMAVNGGPGTAVKILQTAATHVSIFHDTLPAPTIDGKWGPQTVSCVNGLPNDEIVAAFQQARIAYYKAIPGVDPKILAAWIARAEK